MGASDSYRSAKTKIKSGSVFRMFICMYVWRESHFFSMSGEVFDGGHIVLYIIYGFFEVLFGPCVFPCGRVSSTVQSRWNCFFQQIWGLSRLKWKSVEKIGRTYIRVKGSRGREKCFFDDPFRRRTFCESVFFIVTNKESAPFRTNTFIKKLD